MKNLAMVVLSALGIYSMVTLLLLEPEVFLFLLPIMLLALISSN